MSSTDVARPPRPSFATPEPLALSIRRVQGKVVCIVSGELGPSGCLAVERVLVDLVEGQGNTNVVIDMRSARIDNSGAPSDVRVI